LIPLPCLDKVEGSAGTRLASVDAESTIPHWEQAMRALHRTLPAAAAVALSALLPAIGAAQTPTPDQVPTPDGEELVTFTTAFVEIADVRDEMAVRLEEAETPEEAAEIQSEADAQMMEVLDERELSPDRYNQIVQLINVNPELQAEFEQLLLEVRGGEGSGIPDA
jgi:hypothetical protein